MVKFYLVNFKTKFKTFDLVLIGNSEQVTAYAEKEAYNYGSDYFIEQEHEQLTHEMQGAGIVNVANY